MVMTYHGIQQWKSKLSAGGPTNLCIGLNCFHENLSLLWSDRDDPAVVQEVVVFIRRQIFGAFLLTRLPSHRRTLHQQPHSLCLYQARKPYRVAHKK